MKNKTIILGYEEDGGVKFPVILCRERKDVMYEGMMEFYCEYCRKIHKHGMGEGHRLAHCHNEKSPFEKHGYIITLNKDFMIIKDKLEKEIKKQYEKI